MSTTLFVIDDDDVVMLEPNAVSKDDETIGQNQNPLTSMDTIILDEENMDNGKDSTFARLLKNNTLMNKIVKLCLRMENNLGMSRVVNKTVMPLFADADNNFKESEQFTALLKQILRNLKNDPDHKFLHVKSLCEELKAAKYRRKVPFVTLTTSVKKRSVSKEPSKKYNLRKKRKHGAKKTKNNKKTVVIDLDNSDDEPVMYVDEDSDPEDVIINSGDESHNVILVDSNNDDIQNCDSDDDVVVDVINRESDSHNVIAAKSSSQDNIAINNDGIEITCNSDNDGHGIIIARYNDDSNDGEEITFVAQSSKSDVGSDISNKENKTVEESDNRTTPDPKVLVTKDNNKLSLNTKSCELVPKQNNFIPSNNKETRTANIDLLVPKTSVQTDQHSKDFDRALVIEKQIEMYREKIVQLEKTEVRTNCVASPYVLSDKYKANVVSLYKKLCKITGNGDGNVMKYRVVRLQVVEGHPPGPTRRLERLLNNSIDETGNVPLPDFHDVMRCVTEANIADQLNWNRQAIMREAIALFTQCGHALRKNRQRREFKDLMHLAREIELDDNDPANDDPLLLAKLEANKLIAKANEDEVFDRFTKMDYLPRDSDIVTSRVVNVLKVNPADDSDSESELDLTPKKKRKTSVIPGHQSILQNKESEISKEKANETVDVNKKSINEATITNLQRIVTGQPTIETALDKFVTISNIQTTIDTMVKNAFNAVAHNGKITSSQTIVNINTQNETSTIIQNTQFGKSINHTIPTTTNQINATIGNISNTTTVQNLNNTILRTLNNTTTQNLKTTIGNFSNTAMLNQNNTLIGLNNTTIQNPTQIRPYLTINPLLFSTNLPTSQYINVIQQNNNQNQNAPTVTNHTLPTKVTEPRSHLSWSNTLQKVGTSNRYIVSFNSNTSERDKTGKPVEKNGDSNISTTTLNTTEVVEKVNVLQTDVKQDNLTESSLEGTEVVGTLKVAETGVKQENIIESSLKGTEVVETVKVAEIGVKQENHIETTLDGTGGVKNVKVPDTGVIQENLTESPLDGTEVVEKAKDSSVKQEPEDISSLLNALGDNYMSTIFDIEDPFLVIDISSDSSSDDDF